MPDPLIAPGAPAPPADVDLRFLITVGVGGFASAVTMRILDPVMPALSLEFGRGMVEVALLSTWFTFFYAFGQPILGPIGDSFGKARLMSLALVGVALCTAVAALATSFHLFSIARGASGIASGGVIPLAIAMIGDRVPLGRRQVVLARFMMATLTGQVSGGLLAGALSPLIGWRAVLLLAAAIALAAGVASWFGAPPRKGAPRAPFSLARVATNYRDILMRPRAIPFYLLVACEGLLMFGFFPYVAAIIQSRDGAGSFEAGLVVGGFAVGGFLFAAFAGWFVNRLGSTNMMRIGGDIVAISFALFALRLPWWTGIPIFIGVGVGFYMLHNNLQAYATTLSETARGSAVALFACSLFAGVACGPPLIGLLIALEGDRLALLTFAAATLVLGYAAPKVLGIEGPPPPSEPVREQP